MLFVGTRGTTYHITLIGGPNGHERFDVSWEDRKGPHFAAAQCRPGQDSAPSVHWLGESEGYSQVPGLDLEAVEAKLVSR